MWVVPLSHCNYLWCGSWYPRYTHCCDLASHDFEHGYEALADIYLRAIHFDIIVEGKYLPMLCFSVKHVLIFWFIVLLVAQ